MSGSKREAVKVVLIETKYVETDPTNFKSVVQQLTGKDSSLAWMKESSCDFSNGAKREILHNKKQLEDNHVYDYNDNINNASASMLSKGMSSKDPDRLILELPVEEFSLLYSLCSDS
ncbi:uncharacterized protein LOC123218852 [Mangifera indica]|uniref:uncharacterized protein LOC123218852 n=1 Tax=Mangifera indica TaxID=29780 RepID=UPI001CFBED0B|nr:uncharacterized protein LOC123218852 [Mangifera indica]